MHVYFYGTRRVKIPAPLSMWENKSHTKKIQQISDLFPSFFRMLIFSMVFNHNLCFLFHHPTQTVTHKIFCQRDFAKKSTAKDPNLCHESPWTQRVESGRGGGAANLQRPLPQYQLALHGWYGYMDVYMVKQLLEDVCHICLTSFIYPKNQPKLAKYRYHTWISCGIWWNSQPFPFCTWARR